MDKEQLLIYFEHTFPLFCGFLSGLFDGNLNQLMAIIWTMEKLQLQSILETLFQR